MKHYVIGDVHGHYKTLLALVEKLPNDAKLVFVGDLIDRGPQSKEVVKFVREGGHMCVMGNHEELMIKESSYILDAYYKQQHLDLFGTWIRNGGKDTLHSYGVIQRGEKYYEKVEVYQEALKIMEQDIAWMKKLPLYIELDTKHVSGLPVVISHAPIATVWGVRNMESMQVTFRDAALWNRREPNRDAKIFNIFGHTPVREGVETQPHYVNVDTGCYIGKSGYNRLSAYCLETGEVVSVAFAG